MADVSTPSGGGADQEQEFAVVDMDDNNFADIEIAAFGLISIFEVRLSSSFILKIL